MKNAERIVWFVAVVVLVFVSLFGIFVKKADASISDIDQKLLRKIVKVLAVVEREYVDIEKVDKKKLINGAIDGLLNGLDDPHSMYLSEEFMKEMNMTSTGQYGGVGMLISEKDDFIIVVSPFEGTPAFRKGIKAGDFILSVDGKSLKGVSTDVAANMLRGQPGTKIKLEILSGEIKYEVELTREIIVLPTVKHTMINNKYGFIRISEFSGTTEEYVKKAINELKKNKAEAIIVDLRYNPGGMLSVVENIADLFIDEGVIVSTKGRIETSQRDAKKSDTIVDDKIPVIVLIDKGSASASEIFAGAIKDLQRGILIGEKSFGKGSVQQIYQLEDNDGFKITVAKYYTPSGICVDKIGIEPDIEVKEPELTDIEKEALKKIYKDKAIDKIIKENKDPTLEQIDQMVIKLQNEGYNINSRSLKKMIKNAAEIDNQNKIIVDLDYDLQLKKAIEVLDSKKIKYKNKKFNLEK